MMQKRIRCDEGILSVSYFLLAPTSSGCMIAQGVINKRQYRARKGRKALSGSETRIGTMQASSSADCDITLAGLYDVTRGHFQIKYTYVRAIDSRTPSALHPSTPVRYHDAMPWK